MLDPLVHLQNHRLLFKEGCVAAPVQTGFAHNALRAHASNPLLTVLIPRKLEVRGILNESSIQWAVVVDLKYAFLGIKACKHQKFGTR